MRIQHHIIYGKHNQVDEILGRLGFSPIREARGAADYLLVLNTDEDHPAGPALAEKDRHQPEPCATCGVTKYAFHLRGVMRMHGAALRSDVDVQMTDEWFGSDTKTGHREFLVSNRIARLILAHHWPGAVLWPVELV